MKLTEGDKAPPFERLDQEGDTRTLEDFRGKNLVIYFYPKAFTPGCTTESCDFRDRYRAFETAGYEIIGVSPDPVHRLDDFRTEHDLPFPLLSDEDHSMAEDYGAWGTKKNYGREYQGLIRSTVTVDEEGFVSNAWYNVRAKGHAERVASSLG